ncbi:MAG: RNA-directed DNA polymerase [Acidobacteriota bacterium]|nr:RNA-directed DNA polymerase [Acidobacteriota bacterium]
MKTLARAYDRENLERAWRWTRSNSDAAYKGYFRTAYSRYALADSVLLDDLQDRLQRGTYEPAKSCKLYWPKRSGILRPYSLLTVEDQIVYQALVNVVAEQLSRKVQSRYLTETFGHLYGGKSSIWFYRKWSDGYKRFNEAARDAFNRGLKYTASFDLTACYDSLDHRVLQHFLQQIGCDAEFCERLTSLLSIWTATDHQIFHGHGIPQGPLGSGLLSEVVLQHFDQHYGPKAHLRYLRYVDDIRLFAASEADLRKMIVRLDMLSKDVGLFPQSGKIEIHEVKDIEAELKSISNPPEESIKRRLVNQDKLRSRIVELSPRFEIADESRFKYLLAHAQPNSVLNKRLIRILSKRPDLFGNIVSYFGRYERFPTSVGGWFLKEIGRDHLYSAVHARIISTAEGRFNTAQQGGGRHLSQKALDAQCSARASLFIRMLELE